MSTPESTTAPLEILIAEDSPTQAQRLRYILEQQGYRVTVAINGRLALEAARNRKPALIVSDVVMPEMDGYELCRCLKSEPALADTPLILVTTLSDPEDVIRGLECRADSFVLKPYDEHHLLGRLQFVLANHRMSRADQPGMGLEIVFNGQRHFITADRLQILNLLLSTYSAAMQRNRELELANKELETANKDLESFSASVSHDLRSPIRHIDGYAKLILARFADVLPAEARQMVDHICTSTQRLTQLITDLLDFSRLGRQPLAKQTVNVSSLVQDVCAQLQRERHDRAPEIRLGPLPDCWGDPSLLRQVFVNLLGNAFKFTRHREHPLIEVECLEQPKEYTFVVRDNGVGFDMKYASKLFGVFQRLHRTDEFEGTGVGLSIVDRVIQRHGGRIWAEAEVDKGATFYFTIPRP